MLIRISVAMFTIGFFLTGSSIAQEKTRDERVLDDRAKMLENQDWVYEDFEQASMVAEKQGKPLMVVLRCIP